MEAALFNPLSLKYFVFHDKEYYSDYYGVVF